MSQDTITLTENKNLELPLTREFLGFCTQNFSERNPAFDDPYRDKKIKIPEVIQGYSVNYHKQVIEIKRGLKTDVIRYLYNKKYKYTLIDETCDKKAKFFFQFANPEHKLRDYQELGKKIFMKTGSGIISFDCGMGKTILALNIAGTIQSKVIILVHTNVLLVQWLKEIQENIRGEYTVGVIGGGTIRFGDITVALFQAFNSLVGYDKIFQDYGMVVVDECHHIPAETFYNIITKFNAKHFLGLSATLKRKDRKEFLTKFAIGHCLYQKKRKDTGLEQILNVRRLTYLPATTKVLDKKTGLLKTKKLNLTRWIRGSKKKVANWVDCVGGVCYHKPRTEDIIYDIKQALAQNKKILVLSDRVEHCKEIYSLLQPFCKVKLAIGGDSDNLESYKNNPELLDVLVGTKVADEGLDIPSLDTLFLTCPLSLKDAKREENTSMLDQRVGRVARPYASKTHIEVYLYVDMFIDFFNETCNSIINYLTNEGFKLNNLN